MFDQWHFMGMMNCIVNSTRPLKGFDRVKHLSEMVLISNPEMPPEEIIKKVNGLIAALDAEDQIKKDEEEESIRISNEKTRKQIEENDKNLKNARAEFQDTISKDKNHLSIKSRLEKLSKEKSETPRGKSIKKTESKIKAAKKELGDSERNIGERIVEKYGVNLYSVTTRNY